MKTRQQKYYKTRAEPFSGPYYSNDVNAGKKFLATGKVLVSGFFSGHFIEIDVINALLSEAYF
jgi:hypothetical protein